MALDFLLGCFGWKPSKMPEAGETMTQIWLCSLKILFIIPIGITSFQSRNVYNAVKDTPEVQKPPYDEHVLLAHLLTYVGAMTTFAWLVVSAAMLIINKFAWKGPQIFILGLIDLGLAIILCTGVVLQSNYLPSGSSGCKKAETWQIMGEEESFFTVMGGDTSSAHHECTWFVSAWSQAVASLSFQMLITYVGVFFDEREYSILTPFRPLFYFILTIIVPPFWIHAHVIPRLRFAWRYLLKLNRRVRFKDIELEKLNPYTPSETAIIVSNLKLQQVLTIEHVLLELVNNLHFEDVMNLSKTNRAVREAVYPQHDLPYRLPKLKFMACEPASKKPCLYCNKSICFNCKATRFLPGLPGRRHVEMCEPYCRACYFRGFSRKPRGTYKKPCECTKTDRSFEFQQMCRTCGNGDEAVLREKRYLRYRQEARDIAEGRNLPPNEKVKCGKCKLDMKDGTRWWVCGKCKGECKDAIHPPFVKRRKSVDVENQERVAGQGCNGNRVSRWRNLMDLFRYNWI